MGGWAGAVGGGAQPRRIRRPPRSRFRARPHPPPAPAEPFPMLNLREYRHRADRLADHLPWAALVADGVIFNKDGSFQRTLARSEEHTSELQSLMRISYAVFCLKKKNNRNTRQQYDTVK